MRAVPYLQLFLTLTLLSLALILLDNVKLLALPKSAVYSLTNPISYGLYHSWENISQQFYFLAAARFATKEYKAAQEQIGQLLAENASLRTKLAETEAQLDQQSSISPKTHQLLPARPVGIDRYLKIDKGSNDDIKNGQAVIFKDNFIGKIVNVSEKGANVMLLSDPDSKVAAFSMNKDGKAKGILVGQFGSEAIMEKILNEEKITEGDLVYSEGTEGFLPRGLILGKVSQILGQDTQVFKQAKVVPIFDIRDLELVYVIME